MGWDVQFHDAFDEEFEDLPEVVQDELLAMEALKYHLANANSGVTRWSLQMLNCYEISLITSFYSLSHIS